ncbi:hypothetical protein ACEZDB_18925 [Streptacidiphilus sp. N1-3]|uniref:Uncharacterized protein n=1 Tax=Streptacidiphilus alkalitolerans TaxID=3342712 RepID=A0ABV6X367_9ACTN
MDISRLDLALRSAGVDPSEYLLPDRGDAPGLWARDGGIALVAGPQQQWRVYGGAEATFGFTTCLSTFDSERQGCAAFYRELTRADAMPFAEATAVWQQEWARGQQDRDIEATRAHPELATLRARWDHSWAGRRARGEAQMTAAELHTAFQPVGRSLGWHLGGFDPAPVPDANLMAAPGPDGTWWLANTGERGRRPWFIAVGLTEADACTYVFDDAVAVAGFARRTTEVRWRAEIAARHCGGPLPPWPPITC